MADTQVMKIWLRNLLGTTTKLDNDNAIPQWLYSADPQHVMGTFAPTAFAYVKRHRMQLETHLAQSPAAQTSSVLPPAHPQRPA